MAFEVRIPTLGESVTEGVIVRWAKQDGDVVGPDDIVLELETDKASTELAAERPGVLHILRQAGETVAVGDVVARIEDAPSQAASPVAQAPEAARPADRGAPLSPAVRHLVLEHGLDPAVIPATGPGGRLTKEDVLAWVERGSTPAAQPPPVAAPAPPPIAPSPPAAAAPVPPIESVAPPPPPEPPRAAPAPAPPPPRAEPAASAVATQAKAPVPALVGEGEEAVPMGRIRRRIAERLVQAQHTAAILTTFNEVDMSAVMALRAQHKERFRETHHIGLGFMSFFAHAVISALREIPAINAEIRGDDIVYKHFVHLGIAVGTERGLVVPVIHHAERLAFADVEREIERLATRARDGKLTPDDLSGGTFTISNGGVYGSLMSTPILNPPQSGILGMHKIQKRAVVVDDEIVIRPMMYVAVSYDHRLVDGEQAVTFLVRVKERIEDPTRLLLGI
jgi:2-oxoglutarate dehydrogenase E2 component (dihydrolipoamide succinyltransferase)